MVAAARGHARIVRLLLRHGAEINSRSDDGHTALMLASYAGKDAAVAALLAWQRSAPLLDVQSSLGLTALMEAAGEGHIGIVRRLLAHRVPAPPSVDVKSGEGHTALAYACARGKAAIVRALLARSPVDVNTQGGAGKHSPLMLACAQGHVGAVRALLEHHTPPDRELRGADGFTALDYATERGYFQIVRLLSRPVKQQHQPPAQI